MHMVVLQLYLQATMFLILIINPEDCFVQQLAHLSAADALEQILLNARGSQAYTCKPTLLCHPAVHVECQWCVDVLYL